MPRWDPMFRKLETELESTGTLVFQKAKAGDERAGGGDPLQPLRFSAHRLVVTGSPSHEHASSLCCGDFCHQAHGVPAVARIERRTQLVAVTIAESRSA